MTDTCSSCFFGRTAPSGADGLDGLLCCCKEAPPAPGSRGPGGSWPWGPINPAGWCGDGADSTTGRCFSNSVNQLPTTGAGAGLVGTSETSQATVASGSVSFTLDQVGLAYTVGMKLQFTSIGTGEWMRGVVSAFSGASVTITVSSRSGSGTHADWLSTISPKPAVITYGNFTISGTNTGTISDTSVVAGSFILVWGADGNGATIMGSAHAVYVNAQSSGSFSVQTADSGNVTGNFNYMVLN